jgi:carbonic anhydrase/acetyltransferase-like protein (isoleucine patch superfamily)
VQPRRLTHNGAQPSMADNAFVADNGTLIGAVEVGANSSIWFGAVLRADGDAITIGADSNVQDGCVIHTDPGFPMRIGQRVTLGHQAVVMAQ